jgi:hypothetical protein
MNTLLISVRHQIVNKANFRRRSAAAYPADLRNAAAADQLERFAAEIENIPAEAVDRLASIKGSDLTRAVAETSHKVGFHLHPRNAVQFVDLVCERAEAIADERDAVFSKGSAAR